MIKSRIFFALLYFALCHGRNIKECQFGTRCVLLRNCPELSALIQSGNRNGIRQVRQAICGFRRRDSLVCCSSSGGNTTPPPDRATTFQLGVVSNENLLPRFCGRPSTEDKIIGGTKAPIGAYPWIAAMGYSQPGVEKLAFVCAGSIINSKYILTAAHCVVPSELGSKRLAVIHLGDWDLSTPVDCQFTVIGSKCSEPHIAAGFEDIIVHPMFNKRGKASDDIALIRLDVTLDFEGDGATIEPICLPKKGLNVRSFIGNRRPIATGWGFTEKGDHSDILLRVDISLAQDQQCKDLYKKDFVGNQLCVGGDGGQDTCNGDSGGPLVLPLERGPPFTQIGIVSFGVFPCGLQSFPGVYTSVSDYRDWIISNLKP